MKELKKVIWDQENDRYIFIEKNWDGKIIGLNFMQGDDEMAFKDVQKNDKYLLNLYHYMKNNFKIEYQSRNEINFINQVCWAKVAVLDEDLLNEYDH